MKKKLALFDLDGTLFDTSDVNFHSYSLALAEYGFRLDYTTFCRDCNGRSYTDFLPEILGGRTDLMDAVHLRKKDFYRTFLSHARPNHHLISMLKFMQEEYYTAIVTTASRQNTLELLNAFDLTNQFSLILTQEDITKTKPDPEGFLKAMTHFGVAGGDTLIFEDSLVGLQAALCTKAAVMKIEAF